MAFNSKYTGAEVEALLDKVNEGLVTAGEDDTYVVKEVDANGDVLQGVKENGEVYIPTGLSDDAYELIKALTDKVNEIVEYLREWQARQ